MPDMCALWMGGGREELITHCCFILLGQELLAYRTRVGGSEYMLRRNSILYCIVLYCGR